MNAKQQPPHSPLAEEEARLRRLGNAIVVVAAIVVFGGTSLVASIIYQRGFYRSAERLFASHREQFEELAAPAALSDKAIVRLLSASLSETTVQTKLPVPVRREEVERCLGAAQIAVSATEAGEAGLGWLARACTREFNEILVYKSAGAGAAYFVDSTGRVVGLWLGAASDVPEG